MVFANGKNNLEQYVLSDINEMEKIGSTDKVNIVVELGRSREYNAADGDWKGARRYLLQKNEDLSKINSKVLQELPSADMGNYQELADFGKWAKEKYPAEKYMLVIDHHLYETRSFIPPNAISFDSDTNNSIDIFGLQAALRDIGGVDVLVNDGGMQQSAENVYEIKDYAVYITGSEKKEALGYQKAYPVFLDGIINNTKMSPYEAAVTAVEAYSKIYDDDETVGYIQSVIKSSEVSEIMLKKVNDFSDAVISLNDKNLIMQAIKSSVDLQERNSKDFSNFLFTLENNSKDQKVKETANSLAEYIQNNVTVYKKAKDLKASMWREDVKYSTIDGLAIYFPEKNIHSEYELSSWAKHTKWSQFLKWLKEN